MITRNISELELLDFCKNKRFNNSKLLKCHLKIKGKYVIIKEKCFSRTFKSILAYYEPNEITNISNKFKKFGTQHAPSYDSHPSLDNIWIPQLSKSCIVNYMNEFMKYNNIKFDLIFQLQDKKCYRYTNVTVVARIIHWLLSMIIHITNYMIFNNYIQNDGASYDYTDAIHININDEYVQETKGEKELKYKYHIKRYNDKGIIIKETKVQFLKSLINDDNWPEITNKYIHKRDSKDLHNFNITIDELTKKNN